MTQDTNLMKILETIEKTDPNTAINLLSILDPLEKEVVRQLYKANHALTVQEIINNLITELAANIKNKVAELTKKGFIMIKGGYAFANRRRFAGETDLAFFTQTSYPGKTYIKFSDFIDAVNRYFREIEHAKTHSEIIEVKRRMISKFVDIPSFRRVEKILQELEALGIVISREPLQKTKKKKLYTLNPVLRAIIDKTKI